MAEKKDDRLSARFGEETVKRVRDAAAEAGTPPSAYLRELVQMALDGGDASGADIASDPVRLAVADLVSAEADLARARADQVRAQAAQDAAKAEGLALAVDVERAEAARALGLARCSRPKVLVQADPIEAVAHAAASLRVDAGVQDGHESDSQAHSDPDAPEAASEPGLGETEPENTSQPPVHGDGDGHGEPDPDARTASAGASTVPSSIGDDDLALLIASRFKLDVENPAPVTLAVRGGNLVTLDSESQVDEVVAPLPEPRAMPDRTPTPGDDDAGDADGGEPASEREADVDGNGDDGADDDDAVENDDEDDSRQHLRNAYHAKHNSEHKFDDAHDTDSVPTQPAAANDGVDNRPTSMTSGNNDSSDNPSDETAVSEVDGNGIQSGHDTSTNGTSDVHKVDGFSTQSGPNCEENVNRPIGVTPTLYGVKTATDTSDNPSTAVGQPDIPAGQQPNYVSDSPSTDMGTDNPSDMFATLD